MSTKTTWNEMKKPERGNMLTVSAKNCPMNAVFFPELGINELNLFYDEALKVSREPRPGETGRRRVLVPAAIVEGNKLVAKALLMPPTVAIDVRTVMQTAQAVDQNAVMIIEITCTGSGLGTKYQVVGKKSLQREKLSSIIDAITKLDIQAVISKLEGKTVQSVQITNDETSTTIENETEVEDPFADLNV